METKTRYSRLTIDIPNEDHRQLKSAAAILGKSMRELVCEILHSSLLCNPNIACKPMENVENKKELVVCDDAKDMLRKMDGK